MSDRPSGAAPPRLVAVLGPTNTGKTHLAVERMLGHASGMIGLPLRLLDGTDIPRVETRRWRDTAVELPEKARALAFRDVLFGDTLPPDHRIAAAAALARYPATLLHAGRV